MIEPQDKVFANLIVQLLHDLPQKPVVRMISLAAVGRGILRSKACKEVTLLQRALRPEPSPSSGQATHSEVEGCPA